MRALLLLLCLIFSTGCVTSRIRRDVTVIWEPFPCDGYKVRYGKTPGRYVGEEYTGYERGEPKFTFWGMYPGTYYYQVVGYHIDPVSRVYTDGQTLEERHVNWRGF